MFTLPSFQNMFTAILLSFHVTEDVQLMKLQILCDDGNSLFHSSSLLLNINQKPPIYDQLRSHIC